jgi:large subunit ribosomal protein L21
LHCSTPSRGSEIELGDVLLIGGEQPRVGTPTVDGAKVVATVLGTIKGDKIVVFRYKNKKRYRRRTGHRQEYTRVSISKIIVDADEQHVTGSTEGETNGA